MGMMGEEGGEDGAPPPPPPPAKVGVVSMDTVEALRPQRPELTVETEAGHGRPLNSLPYPWRFSRGCSMDRRSDTFSNALSDEIVLCLHDYRS